MEKKLEVKNLTISFKTQSGKLQAVRDISFDLYKGETLAIVGESGSGKSVTSKAVMGILAGNSIVENGEIIYEGQDLLKITEEDFHKLRGNKISMIFQDPLSSLNPIVKIGKQLTEAMILKGKARQKECKNNFNSYLSLLKETIIKEAKERGIEDTASLELQCTNFNKFEYKHLELENKYNIAINAAENGSIEIDACLFEIEKKVLDNVQRRVNDIIKFAEDSINKWVVDENKDRVLKLKDLIKENYKKNIKDKEFDTLKQYLTELKEYFDKAKVLIKPNFFAMGYYVTFVNEELPTYNSIDELNTILRKELDEKFMLSFIEDAKKGLICSFNEHDKLKLQTIEVLKQQRNVFEVEQLDEKASVEAFKIVSEAVNNSINKLALVKDSPSYTFASALKSKINMYFRGVRRNDKEQAKYNKDNAKIEKIIESGKVPEWKPVPPAIVNLEQTRLSILKLFDELIIHLAELVKKNETINFDELTIDVIDQLKEWASGVVKKVTNADAKNTAIKIMEEVGIQEARKRFYQYPFEFSGGMRQRIVIAIALASNPDILICDEPTTALDVTIQAQILELINKLKKERNLSIIFITHDLGVVANMADRVAVMYAGKIVEYGTVDDIFYEPKHPYTWALLSSIPDLDTNERLDAIPGTPPNMIYPPKGDAFAARNKYAMQIDFEEQPPMFKVNDNHYAATWLLHESAPQVEPPKIVIDRINRMKKVREEGEKNNE